MTATLVIDVDGCLVRQTDNYHEKVANKEPSELLPGVRDKFREWEQKGYRIVLMTGRRESSRKITEETLTSLGIFYDHLVMGVGTGPRYLVNDLKPGRDEPTAVAINLKRNEGLADVSI